MDFKKLAEQYKSELLDNVLPFWLEHSQDRECGGYYTCLDRDGRVFDTDKFIWRLPTQPTQSCSPPTRFLHRLRVWMPTTSQPVASTAPSQ